MKVAFTLFIFPLLLNTLVIASPIEFNVNSYISKVDSAKIVAAVAPASVKTNVIAFRKINAIKLPVKATHTDSVKSEVILNSQVYGLTLLNGRRTLRKLPTGNGVKPGLMVFALDSADINRAPDSAQLAVAVKLTDSLLKSTLNVKYLDSLKLAEAVYADSLKKNIKSISLDSLKKVAKTNKYQSLKGPLYSEIAARYLAYDTISSKKIRTNYQNEALNYTMLALHQFSSFNDTTGLRVSFDGLAKVYLSQKKYSQAKWFVLQSNSLSRSKKDVPNIISSLMMLATVKGEIKDYALAIKDLDEAQRLAETHHYQQIELNVLKNYALLYSAAKNYPKEELYLKKRDSLLASIQKDEDAKQLAALKAQTLIQKKKVDSLQKKKVYTSDTRKLYKNNSSGRIASL